MTDLKDKQFPRHWWISDDGSSVDTYSVKVSGSIEYISLEEHESIVAEKVRAEDRRVFRIVRRKFLHMKPNEFDDWLVKVAQVNPEWGRGNT